MKHVILYHRFNDGSIRCCYHIVIDREQNTFPEKEVRQRTDFW